MKKIFYVLGILALAGTACTKNISEDIPAGYPEHSLMTKIVGDTQGEFQQGSLLVKFDEETASGIASGESALIQGLVAQTGINDIAPALLIQPKNIQVARKYGLHRWYMVSFDEAEPLEKMASRIAELKSVTALQYNSFLEQVSSDKVIEFVPVPDTKDSPVPEEDAVMFDDPYLNHQWNLVNDGTVDKSAVAGADVGVKDAWKLTAGDPSVVVAVFDCAVNSVHEDLMDALWKNQAEIDGQMGVDDDGNGYIDDKYGFNFVGCFKLNEGFVNDRLDGKPVAEAVKGNLLNWSAGSGHGTHVAGTVAAVNDNNIFGCGIAGGDGTNPGVRLMSCQTNNGRDASYMGVAFTYAADNGAVISQNSWSLNGTTTPTYLIEAIEYLGLHKVNGDSIPNGVDAFYDFNIYVGGAMLGRGLTLKGLAITYIIFILLVFIARRTYLSAAPKFDGTAMDLILQAQSEEDMSVYGTLKCFDELAEAEKLKSKLDEHNIPSMIYGANKPDYISREDLPIQVMVRKLDKRLLEK